MLWCTAVVHARCGPSTSPLSWVVFDQEVLPRPEQWLALVVGQPADDTAPGGRRGGRVPGRARAERRVLVPLARGRPRRDDESSRPGRSPRRTARPTRGSSSSSGRSPSSAATSPGAPVGSRPSSSSTWSTTCSSPSRVPCSGASRSPTSTRRTTGSPVSAGMSVVVTGLATAPLLLWGARRRGIAPSGWLTPARG